MTPTVALLSFTLAASVLTVTPGLDTVLVLRTAIVGGSRQAAAAALGICCGLLIWGLAVALGLGALLTASTVAYTALRWAGAAYLLWLGFGLLFRPPGDRLLPDATRAVADGGAARWFGRGLTTNLLNPKIGVFYVSFLPQFVPAGIAVTPFVALLVAIHVVEGVLWFLLLIAATQPAARWLRHPAAARLLNRLTGAIFVAFGLRLAAEP